MNLRYSVTFHLLPRALRDGTHSVAVTVTWCRRRWRRTLPVSCPADCWEPTLQLARSRGDFHRSAEINEAVLSARERIDALFTQSASAPTVLDLDSLFSGGTLPNDQRTVADVIEEFITMHGSAHSWQSGTVAKFTMLRRELNACGITYLEELNEASAAKFYAFHASRGIRNSTLSKKVAILNWFIRWCNDKGYTDIKTQKPHLRNVPRAVTYLEWDELMHFYTFDFGEHYSLAHVRDVFCFCAFTGLRFSDAAALRWDDIEHGTLHVVTVKTADRLDIPLNKYSKDILNRYAGTRGRVFHSPCNQAANRSIKDAAMLAGLDRPMRQVYYRGAERHEETLLTWEAITTHMARRTFVVHSLRLGITAEVVMRFTGHSDYTAMRPYIAIADELKVEAMQKFDDT